MRESHQETERALAETERVHAETERALANASREIENASLIVGKLGNKFGELAEHLVAPNMSKKFNALGYNFTCTGTNIKFHEDVDGKTKIVAEVDVLLNNRDFVMAVEVKAQPLEEHVRAHIKRMEALRRYADKHDDRRKYIGAIAGAIMNDQVKLYAINSGFYVIEQSGDTMKINAPEGFKPREW
jgi:hypothetical protein